jgi:hypothetical protein
LTELAFVPEEDVNPLAEALEVPRTAAEAIALIERTVLLIGPRFHPDASFSDYVGVQRRDMEEELDLSDKEVEQLNAATSAARELLGGRVYDIAYRSAVAYLDGIDTEWAAWARPVTQPPARWWLVEPAEGRETQQPTTIAYQDEVGRWWEYDPATRLLHETPQHYARFYYPTEPWVSCYSSLEPEQAREHIQRGTGAHEIAQLQSSRQRDNQAMDPYVVLGRLADARDDLA